MVKINTKNNVIPIVSITTLVLLAIGLIAIPAFDHQAQAKVISKDKIAKVKKFIKKTIKKIVHRGGNSGGGSNGGGGQGNGTGD